ncbi:MAG: hypothetical protein ACTS4X_01875 [Candidatus Hodgkinia cicadicola]
MKCGKRGKFNWWMKFPLSLPRELVEVLKKLRGGNFGRNRLEESWTFAVTSEVWLIWLELDRLQVSMKHHLAPNHLAICAGNLLSWRASTGGKFNGARWHTKCGSAKVD